MLLLPNEAAKLLRVHVKTLKRWENKGRIKSIRINERGDRRYRREDIDKILNQEI